MLSPVGSKNGAVMRALAPTNVASVQILRRSHMWLEFVVGSLLCSKRFFWELRFSLSSKASISKFQFDLEMEQVNWF